MCLCECVTVPHLHAIKSIQNFPFPNCPIKPQQPTLSNLHTPQKHVTCTVYKHGTAQKSRRRLSRSRVDTPPVCLLSRRPLPAAASNYPGFAQQQQSPRGATRGPALPAPRTSEDRKPHCRFNPPTQKKPADPADLAVIIEQPRRLQWTASSRRAVTSTPSFFANRRIQSNRRVNRRIEGTRLDPAARLTINEDAAEEVLIITDDKQRRQLRGTALPRSHAASTPFYNADCRLQAKHGATSHHRFKNRRTGPDVHLESSQHAADRVHSSPRLQPQPMPPGAIPPATFKPFVPFGNTSTV